jgi:hypothetical protein
MPFLRNEQQVYSRNQGMLYKAEYVAGYVVYEGWAVMQSLTISESDAVFQICKHTYDADHNLIQTDWGNNSDSFNLAWSLRTTYF